MDVNFNQREPNEPHVLRTHAPTMDRQRRSAESTSGEMKAERSCADWFAQRTWEDDGGRVGWDGFLRRERSTMRDTQRFAIVDFELLAPANCATPSRFEWETGANMSRRDECAMSMRDDLRVA
jgi:hypothetical protein